MNFRECFRPGEFMAKQKHTAAAAAKSLQSCPTVCDPIDGSPLGSRCKLKGMHID